MATPGCIGPGEKVRELPLPSGTKREDTGFMGTCDSVAEWRTLCKQVYKALADVIDFYDHLRLKHILKLVAIGVIYMGLSTRSALFTNLMCGSLILATAITGQGEQASALSGKGSTSPKESDSVMRKIGIFGFGSLIADPGEELTAATIARVQAETPFAIEYGHSSTHTRAGAPTLVPVKTGGAKAMATIFVLKDSLSDQDAANILYRRETRQIGSGKAYKRPANPGPNNVLVESCPNVMGVEKVLYTDFADSGKLVNPTAKQLAELAIGSARSPEVPDGMDGITYLMNAKKAGIITPLTADYEKEILKQTGTTSLDAAVAKLRPNTTKK
jgi:hypothetical protein